MTGVKEPVVASIIVCTHNRAEFLKECLQSILADGSRVPRELIVVDNASTDTTERVVREMGTASSELPVRYVFEPALGQSYARNQGAALAKGRFLLFTDDDAVVEDGWTSALVEPFADPAIGAVGGRIIARWPYTPPRWLNGELAVSLGLPDFGEEERVFERSETPLGVNMAVRTEIARAMHPPFDTSLGHRGPKYMGHEEILFLEQVRRTYLLVYRPQARVVHRVLPQRMNLRTIRGSFFRAGFGIARTERLLGEPVPGLPRKLVRAARTCWEAWKLSRRNKTVEELSADAAYSECRAYMWAGKHLEMLFGRFPRVTDWMAGYLA